MGESMKTLPTWEECNAKAKAGKATAIELFIAENEPIEIDDAWRQKLSSALQEARAGGLVDGAAAKVG